jgi:hypothetical protein
MSKRIVLTLCAVLMLVPAVLLATDSRGLSARKKKAKTASEVKSFTFSTEYTGTIGGSMVIAGTRYALTKKTSVYVVGEGARPQGFSVSHQSINLAGKQIGDDFVVTSVVVRPKPTKEIVGDGSDGVGIKTEPSAR